MGWKWVSPLRILSDLALFPCFGRHFRPLRMLTTENYLPSGCSAIEWLFIKTVSIISTHTELPRLESD